MHRLVHLRWLLACLAVWLTAVGCGGNAPATSSDIDDPDSAAPELRIVSFSPAFSRIAVDLGLGEAVVGRTPWCTSLDPDVPVVGRLDDADFERLVRLKPTHLLVQPPATGVHSEIIRLAEENDWTIVSDRVNGVDDIRRATELIAETFAADAPDRTESIRVSVRDWRERLDAVLQPLPGADSAPNVLLAIPGDPVLAYGRDTYLDDLLSRFGLKNAVSSTGWVELTLEDAARLNPGIIVVIRSGESSDDAMESIAGPLATLPVEAVRENRFIVLQHPEAIIPSTSVVDVADELLRKLSALLEPPQ